MRFLPIVFVFFVAYALLLGAPLVAQSPNGTINGLVQDPANRAIVDAEIVIVNDATGVKYLSKTNGEGIYVVPNLPPGPYRLQVSKVGFKTLIKPDIVLNVQDALSINFTLPIGAFSETVTVEGGAPLINTQDATVSTVVDRQFAENLPLNGRSFQSLIQLTPGVVLTGSTGDNGQFSVNGQRATSNYWMVDGVSANIGVGSFASAGDGFGGALGSFSVLGGTNSLVSVDAMQEFRIQTSTYAPEFGRTPGGQISIVTRSGTNQFHGTLFDYLRNDVLDANNWFNTAVTPPLPKPEERQNDFGGTLSGPILKNRTFFFFSYEGLRLRLPQTALTTVPDIAARQNAVPAMQPFLNAFPLPTGADNPATGVAQFNKTFSNPATLDAYSLRIDHNLNRRWTLFGRYNYSPSKITQRGAGLALSAVSPFAIMTQTSTLGATRDLLSGKSNDLRFNYSRTNGTSSVRIDNFGGAVPLSSLPFPSGFNDRNARLVISIASLTNGGTLIQGNNAGNHLRQVNLVDNFVWQSGSHTIKLGADFRRLLPFNSPTLYGQVAVFPSVSSAGTGNLLFSQIQTGEVAALLVKNFGAFAQDTWRASSRLTLTYGIRWDVDFAPSSTNHSTLPAVVGFDLNNLSGLTLAAPGTPPFATRYGNFAPRIGVAYQVFQNPSWQTVLRGGFGIFYDLASSAVGNDISGTSYPFGASSTSFGGQFPFSPAAAAPPAITVPGGGQGTLFAFDPNLRLPYTLQWNVAFEQGMGAEQTLTASYVGSAGRRLLQTAIFLPPNPNFAQARLIGNTASSDYDALQIQFQRRLSHGLQILASYIWTHSIDDGSASSGNFVGNTFVPGGGTTSNRGPSDFDIRNAMTLALTYDIPAVMRNRLAHAFTGGWSLENIIQARSAPPVDVFDSLIGQVLLNAQTHIRPDVVPGQPFYIFGPQYPGGKALNPAAFVAPVAGKQGNLGRNALRGFGAGNWDLAIHRDFLIREPIKLQFRAEMFNVLNHPNFGPPVADLSRPNFGVSTELLGQSLAGGALGGGAFSPLYQLGGPRSIQFGLKLTF